MIEDRRLDTNPWITDRVPLSRVPRVFQELRQRPGTLMAMIEVHDSDAD